MALTKPNYSQALPAGLPAYRQAGPPAGRVGKCWFIYRIEMLKAEILIKTVENS
jgi:hypothetical protein